jgi:hypothetical protein
VKPRKKVATPSSEGRPAVQAWLAALDPARRRLARRLDQIILDAIPDAVSTVKFRKPSQPLGVPFYGLPEKGWFAHVNELKGRVRITFFAGSALKPAPPLPAPGGSRASDIPVEDDIDEKQVKAWLKQATKLPGWGKVPSVERSANRVARGRRVASEPADLSRAVRDRE